MEKIINYLIQSTVNERNVVRAWEEDIMLPTYEIGEEEKNPIFLEKRVYQGSSGVVYPYPVVEKVSDEKLDKQYKALFIENEYIKVMILPELGGRIQMAYDKVKQRHFVYYNQVIKPALVGLTGPWISGGIEFNWPQHHRPSTFLPTDYLMEENRDGSITVWCNEVERMFRTKGMQGFALTLKAKLLVTAASPLFNGNPDYTDFTDKDGIRLFNTEYDQNKWIKAADACYDAIESCKLNNIQLYTFKSNDRLSDTTKIQMSIRNSVGEKWNSELIWGLSGRAVNSLQSVCMARIDPANLGNMWAAQERLNPTIEIANNFYTDKGVPINEDKTWDYSGRHTSQVARTEERFNLAEGYATAKLNYHRENRYYANLAFDGSVWYMQNSRSGSDENTFTVKARMGQPQAKLGAYNYSVTGYWPKKLISWKFVLSSNSSTTEWFPWPELRLADLYLLYAEALNENDQTTAALEWIDLVRERAGLKGVNESWTTYSTKPDKFKTKAGLREIIQQERTVELAFEGQRFWDLRRWKTAATVLNQKIHGWDIDQEVPEAYYRPKVLFDQEFLAPRDYLWPLREESLYYNKSLVQNPGW